MEATQIYTQHNHPLHNSLLPEKYGTPSPEAAISAIGLGNCAGPQDEPAAPPLAIMELQEACKVYLIRLFEEKTLYNPCQACHHYA